MSQHFASGHALLIGVGGNLPNTVADAQGLGSLLQDESRCAYPAAQVHTLTGDQATRSAILQALESLAQASDEQSTVLVYFSGHGYRVHAPTGQAYYLMPYGYDLRRLYQTAISGAEFTAQLTAIPAQKLLLLLDCCHAGGVGENPGLELAKAPLPQEALELLSQGRGRVLIASSREDELSFAGRPYSAFTLALVEALCGRGAARPDGCVRVADLALYAREVVPGRTRGRQHPLLHFEHADNFIVAYYAGGATQAKELPLTVEPEIEPQPGAWRGFFDQRGQAAHGPQTNIGGDVHGSVLSGEFHGPVSIGDKSRGEQP